MSDWDVNSPYKANLGVGTVLEVEDVDALTIDVGDVDDPDVVDGVAWRGAGVPSVGDQVRVVEQGGVMYASTDDSPISNSQVNLLPNGDFGTGDFTGWDIFWNIGDPPTEVVDQRARVTVEEALDTRYLLSADTFSRPERLDRLEGSGAALLVAGAGPVRIRHTVLWSPDPGVIPAPFEPSTTIEYVADVTIDTATDAENGALLAWGWRPPLTAQVWRAGFLVEALAGTAYPTTVALDGFKLFHIALGESSAAAAGPGGMVAQRTANFAVASNTFTEVPFKSKLWGTPDYTRSGTNGIRIGSSGVHLCYARLAFEPDNQGRRTLLLKRYNEAGVEVEVLGRADTLPSKGGNNERDGITVTAVRLLNVGDLIVAEVWQNSGGSLAVTGTSTLPGINELSVARFPGLVTQ